MKLPISSRHAERANGSTALAKDDTLGRGMEMALTILLFLVAGALLDFWLGTAPLFTIALIVIGAVGSFAQLKYAYDARMDQLEAERQSRLAGGRGREATEAAR